MSMTQKELEKLSNGDSDFVHNATCPIREYQGIKDPESRERRVVYAALRKNASRVQIEDLLSTFPAGKPFQQATDKDGHLDKILARAKEKDVTGPQITSASVSKKSAGGMVITINGKKP